MQRRFFEDFLVRPACYLIHDFVASFEFKTKPKLTWRSVAYVLVWGGLLDTGSRRIVVLDNWCWFPNYNRSVTEPSSKILEELCCNSVVYWLNLELCIPLSLVQILFLLSSLVLPSPNYNYLLHTHTWKNKLISVALCLVKDS